MISSLPMLAALPTCAVAVPVATIMEPTTATHAATATKIRLLILCPPLCPLRWRAVGGNLLRLYLVYKYPFDAVHAVDCSWSTPMSTPVECSWRPPSSERMLTS